MTYDGTDANTGSTVVTINEQRLFFSVKGIGLVAIALSYWFFGQALATEASFFYSAFDEEGEESVRISKETKSTKIPSNDSHLEKTSASKTIKEDEIFLSLRICLIASKKGSDSISPTVPPIS